MSGTENKQIFFLGGKKGFTFITSFISTDLSQLGALDNENALESIEDSFKQFQQFLDMLKNLG